MSARCWIFLVGMMIFAVKVEERRPNENQNQIPALSEVRVGTA